MSHINALKGIAIIMIIAFHICGQIFHGEPKWFRTLSYQGVQIFFFLSGIGLTYSYLAKQKHGQNRNNWITWYIKRSLRILPLYWLVLLITLIFSLSDTNILKIALNKQNGELIFHTLTHICLLHVYFSDTYFSINVAWWFLAIIAHFYLLFPVIVALNKHTFLQPLVFAITLIAYVINRSYHLVNNQIGLSFLFFMFGISLAYWNINRINNMILKVPKLWLLASLLMSIYFQLSLKKDIPELFKPYTYEFYSISVTSFLYVFSLYLVNCLHATSNEILYLNKIIRNIGDKFLLMLEYCGKVSFSLFLIHWGLIAPVVRSFGNISIGIMIYLIIIVILSTIFTAIDDLLTNFVSAKIKYQSRL